MYLNEPGCGRLLSEPVPLFSLDLNDPPSAGNEANPPEPILVTAAEPGIFNAVVTWFDLDFGGATGPLSFAPNRERPRHMYYRAIKNRLRFAGYEQRLEAGDIVQLSLVRSRLAVRFPASSRARSH